MKTLLLSIFLFTALWANETNTTRTAINFATEANGTLAPEVVVTVPWNANWFSSVAYKSASSVTSSTVSGFSQSKDAIALQEQTVTLNLVTYQDVIGELGFAAGVSIQYLRIDKNEFGYLALSDTNWTAFDNQIGIEYYQPMLYVECSTALANVDLRLSGVLAPTALLSVTQSTQFKPLVSTTGTSASSTWQSMGYEIAADAFMPTDLGIALGFRFFWKYLPVSYNIATLKSDLSGFDTTTLKTAESTMNVDLKVAFEKRVMDMLPFVGYRLLYTSVSDLLTAKSESQTAHRLLFGFENRF